MSAPLFELIAIAGVLAAAATMSARRSRRAGVVLLIMYGAQAACLIWASRTFDVAAWSGPARVALCVSILAVLAHRISTYAFPRSPAARDRFVVPIVHVAQAWLMLVFFAWPVRALVFPASTTVDAWTLCTLLAVSIAGLIRTHRLPRITRLQVSVAALGRPIRVVHLSDLHLGPYLSESRLAWLADATTAERPDVLAITGDFLTLRTQLDWTPLLQFIERLRVPDGVFACLGNHDVAVADDLSATLRSRGVTVLRDDVAWLRSEKGDAPIAVAGLEWRSGRGARQAYTEALAVICERAGPVGPAVVLCHQPSAFALLPATFGGIMLAGHLHGGQVGITWGSRGVSLLRLLGKYDQGLFARGRAKLYSHRGTGVYGFPLRLGVPAEIAVLDLMPEERHASRTPAGPARPIEMAAAG